MMTGKAETSGKRKAIKVIRRILILIAVAVAAVLVYYTAREYRPENTQELETGSGTRQLSPGDSLSVLTWNTGYAGLGEDEDFFMDGGSKVRPDSADVVEENLKGICSILQGQEADVLFLQELDRNARRSYHVDELAWYEDALGMDGSFAYNYKCDFVPYPWPPIGRVEAGIATLTDYQMSGAARIALPESFRWPVKTCNLKRCMLEVRIPVEGTDRELVLINFHLEAYDSGEGKAAQSAMLAEKLTEEYEKGNYVIAGGDFNQTFDGIDAYPIHNKEDWVPGVYEEADIPEGFSLQAAQNVPTCRLLNAPYSGNYEDSQVYVIDGFLVSENLSVDRIENMDTEFEYSDHQPVRLEVTLKEDM